MDRIRFFSIFMIIACSCNPTDRKAAIPDNIPLLGFEPVEIQATANFRGISVVDSSVVWVSGSRGTYLRTIDGGTSWSVDSVSGYTYFDFRDIEAFDANTAVMMSAGKPAIILRTDNGGEKWSTCYYDDREGIFLNSLAFWDREEGLAVGDPIDGRFLILTTQDGGETWTEIIPESRPEAYEGEYLFAASGTALTVADNRYAWFGTGGSTSRVFFSKDNGMNWHGSGAPMISGTPSSGIFSLCFADRKNGWAVGGDYTREEGIDRNAILSWNGGKTWQLVHESPSGYRSCILQFSAFGMKILLCTGPSGTDYSVDQGVSWTFLESPGYHTMDVGKNGTTVWGAGADGRIGKLEYSVTRGVGEGKRE
jgi:photosystem II stability/assembly factor-like uncharacterized protein